MAIAYERDFYGWTQEQAALLRTGNLAQLDIENLLEEVETMGRSEKRELQSRLEVLLAHLLKWQCQPVERSSSWNGTIREQRKRIAINLEENPSLASRVQEVMEKAYLLAIDQASDETGLEANEFPADCPWTFEQVVDKDFFPEG